MEVSVNMTQSTAIDKKVLLARYDALAALPKQVLELTATIGMLQNADELYWILSEIDYVSITGKVLGQAELKKNILFLQGQQLLYRYNYLEVNQAVFPEIVRAILRGENSQKYSAILKIFYDKAVNNLSQPRLCQFDAVVNPHMLRQAFYFNDLDFFTQAPIGYPEDYFYQNILLLIPQIFPGQDVYHFGIFMPLLEFLIVLARLWEKNVLSWSNIAQLDNVIDTYIDLSGVDLPNYINYLAIQTDLYLGRLNSAKKRLRLFNNTTYYYLYSVASLKFFATDFVTALLFFEQGLKALRREYKRKHHWLNDLNGSLHLFALLMDPNNASKVLETINKGINNDLILDDLTVAVKIIAMIMQGQHADAKQYLAGLSSSISKNSPNSSNMLVLYAYVKYLYTADLSKSSILLRLKQQFLNNKLNRLLKHVSAELLHKITHEPQYAKYLARSPFSTLSFLSLFKFKAEWETNLDHLTKLLCISSPATKMPNKSRLAWTVDPRSLEFAIYEQTMLVSGTWNKGKLVTPRKIYKKELALDLLTEQDKRALLGLKIDLPWKRREPRNEDFFWDKQLTLLALIDHPYLFHTDNIAIPLELKKGNLQLNIEEQQQGYKLSLSHYATETRVFLEKETPNVYNVIEITPAVAHVCKILHKNCLQLPKDAKDKVIDLIKNIGDNSIQINSDLSEIDLPTIKSDSTCYVQIFPINDGLRVSIGVRPFGSQGPLLRAGHGQTRLIATIPTIDSLDVAQKMRTTRIFSEEVKHFNKLISSCKLMTGIDIHSEDLVFNELEDCLEILNHLQNYQPITLEWPKGQSLQVSKTITASDLSLRISGSQNWFEYEGEISLDEGRVFSLQQLLTLLETQATGRFIKLDSGQFIALTDSFKKRIAQLQVLSEGNKIFHLGANVLDSLAKEAKDLQIDHSWQQHLDKIKQMQQYQPKLPKTLQAELRDYQKIGFNYLSLLSNWGMGACLADDMGLGKTIQAITLLLEQAEHGAALVIAPTTVSFNWMDEITRFAPSLKLYLLADTAIDAREQLVNNLQSQEVLLCSYGLLPQVEQLLINKAWQTIILDEAQAIKNANTKRWNCVIKLQANCRIALTGTPIENHLGELWSIFRFLNPGLLGNIKKFQQKFMQVADKNNEKAHIHALKQLVQPYILRRLKTEVLNELPAKTENIINIKPSDDEIAFYAALRQKALEKIGSLDGAENTKRFSILAEITKLRQACCDPSLIAAELNIESSKIKIFKKIVADLIENKHQVLVFSQYVKFLNKIKSSLDLMQIKYQYIDGSTPANQRKQEVDRFQAGESDVFLLSLKAGGTGLNLTAADYVIHLDPWWNPAVEDQASDRAHRIGQQRPVTIYKFIVKNTIEEKIIKLHQQKRDLASDLLSGTEISATLSSAELLNLIN